MCISLGVCVCVGVCDCVCVCVCAQGIAAIGKIFLERDKLTNEWPVSNAPVSIAGALL